MVAHRAAMASVQCLRVAAIVIAPAAASAAIAASS
jgi:hypothetical protein